MAFNIANILINFVRVLIMKGVRGVAVGWGTALLPEGRRFDSRWGYWYFHWLNPPVLTVALGSTQPLTEMSTKGISWGVKVAGA
jgi:hypothetical protein